MKSGFRYISILIYPTWRYSTQKQSRLYETWTFYESGNISHMPVRLWREGPLRPASTPLATTAEFFKVPSGQSPYVLGADNTFVKKEVLHLLWASVPLRGAGLGQAGAGWICTPTHPRSRETMFVQDRDTQPCAVDLVLLSWNSHSKLINSASLKADVLVRHNLSPDQIQ